MSKNSKEKTSEKIHVEIAMGNWTRMEDYIQSYNDSPERMTPRIKPADVVNDALAKYLKTLLETEKRKRARDV